MKNEKYYYNVGDKVEYINGSRSQRKGYIKDIYIKDFKTGPMFLLSTFMEGEVWVNEDKLLGVIPRVKELTCLM